MQDKGKIEGGRESKKEKESERRTCISVTVQFSMCWGTALQKKGMCLGKGREEVSLDPLSCCVSTSTPHAYPHSGMRPNLELKSD